MLLLNTVYSVFTLLYKLLNGYASFCGSPEKLIYTVLRGEKYVSVLIYTIYFSLGYSVWHGVGIWLMIHSSIVLELYY